MDNNNNPLELDQVVNNIRRRNLLRKLYRNTIELRSLDARYIKPTSLID